MNTGKYIIILLLISNFCYTQTIINAERLINGKDSTIYAISFSYNGSRGNSNLDQIDISPAIILLKKGNEYKLFGGYNFLSDSGSGILNSGFVHIRHNYRLSSRFKTFEFYQSQFNDVILLVNRQVLGAGLRYSLINKDSLKLEFELGIMREREVLNQSELLAGEMALLKKFRITSVNICKWNIGKQVKINNVIYFQPDISNFNDYRLLNDFNVIVSVTNHIELITAIITRYDNEPPGALKNLDALLNFGLNVKFKK